MPTAVIDGIATHYEIRGDGPPLLLFSPGGFNATLDNWTSFSIYARLRLVDQLAKSYTCVLFDRRESGASGGRVERITWADYAAQGKGLLDHLGIARAHLMGGCVGCSVAAVFAAAWPESAASLVLYSPAGGARYRIAQHNRFARHLSYLSERSVASVVGLALSSDRGFTQDPRVGPWVSVIRNDPAFADAFRDQDKQRYEILVAGMARTLFDRDTVPGPEPEDLLRLDVPALVVPGQDASHATSAARYLQECLPRAQYWDVPVSGQTEETAPARVLEFLGPVSLLARAEQLAPFDRGDLVETVLVAAALERGGEPPGRDHLRQGGGDDLRPEDEHVGVVVGAGDLRGEQVVADPGPDAGDLVARHLLARAGAADHDAAVGLPVRD
jgi:pimeloyl-ACP methyl ester carboxylesterase